MEAVERSSVALKDNMNRDDLIKKMNEASSVVLREKGYISFVDILISIGKLSQEDYEAWRFRKVPSLESVIRVNLPRINLMLRTLHQNAKKGGLRASTSAYVSWGKRPRVPLSFGKSGDPHIEEAYSTHFLKPYREDTILTSD
jgi:hypothetical protein